METALTLSARDTALLGNFLSTSDLNKLYNNWYKKKGRALEKELVENAKATAFDDTLRRKCSESRFRDILRRAFKEEEDEDDVALLAHCKAVLQDTPGIPGTPDAFIEVHRVICGASTVTRSLDEVTVRQLASDGSGGAQELAEGIGCAAVAPMVKAMAKDLL